MFSFIKSLFSSEPTQITSMIKGVGGWIDERNFTEEEKAKADMLVLDYQLKWLAATQGMNLARRFIAILFASVFCFLLVVTVAVFAGFFFAGDVEKGVEFVNGIVAILSAYRFGEMVIALFAFYFGKGIFERYSGKKG